MGSFSLFHWVIVLVVVVLLFGGGRISGVMGDVAKGIKAFKKGMSDDEAKPAEKPEPVKSIDSAPSASTSQRTDVGSKAV